MSDIQVFISEAEINARIHILAREITAGLGDIPVTLVCALKGAALFAADLLRVLPPSYMLEFDRAKSYEGTVSTGKVTRLMPAPVLTDRHVLIVEDIIDTGRTMQALLADYRAQKPASLHVCTLLDKPSRREVPVSADFIGFSIPDRFVVGYGMDYEEAYRGLPYIGILNSQA